MSDIDPLARIADWLAQAREHEPEDAEAMSLATVGADGRPSVRMVLVRGLDARGLVFYTNLTSRKARELVANPHVALCFHWKSTGRQIRVEGPAGAVDAAEADAYFASRPRDSQIGAWASKQSSELEGRFKLEQRVARYAAAFAIGPVPRPEFWSGFRVVPERVEFWEKGRFRLHQRELFERGDAGWRSARLYP